MSSYYKKKILIIHSDKSQLENLKQLLSQYPFEIMTVSDGTTGFEILKDNKPDIVLASSQLTDIDGIELCWMIRQNNPFLFEH